MIAVGLHVYLKELQDETKFMSDESFPSCSKHRSRVGSGAHFYAINRPVRDEMIVFA